MIVGFGLATVAVVANDSLQTLGTYLGSNRSRTPKALQMLFLCSITVGILLLGWFLNGGDPAWGRLSVPGREFPLPEPITWVDLLPPLAVLALTQWGAPVSTSFLLLSALIPAHSAALLASSLAGYGLAFLLAVVAYGLGVLVQQRLARGSDAAELPPSPWWLVLQWLSTGFLLSLWLVQDLANIYVYLPRRLDLPAMVLTALVLCAALCVLVMAGGGPIQAVLQSKTDVNDLRAATLIDALFGLSLLLKALLGSFPLSTTWVFLGLLAGRELVMRLSADTTGGWFSSISPDLWKASAGIAVSIGLAFSLQPLKLWSGG